MLGRAITATALGIFLSMVAPAFSASAATLEGVVTTSAGQPVNGAMVTVFSANRMRKQTVFTDPEGRYLVVVDYEGQLTVRARASSFVDQTQTVSIDEAESQTIDLTLAAFESDIDRSNALPASAHLTTLPWRDAEERAPFVAQCNYCHQVGNPLTRGKRSAESWAESIEKMEGYMAIVTDEQVERFSKVLSSGFDGDRSPRENKHVDLSAHKMMSGVEYDDLFNLPYGIDINPKDGGVWYAKLYGNMLGHVDPETLEITEYQTPLKGPRRPRFDADGILWIPSFDESALLRFDPTTGEFKTYPLPTLSPDEYETPYALNVHPETGDVWMTSNMSDRILRFIPKEERFISYPSPTRVTWLRDLTFTKDGKVCSSSSNLPAYAIEDGVPSFICIDPAGADKDRARASSARREH
jgi:hypothetical protein